MSVNNEALAKVINDGLRPVCDRIRAVIYELDSLGGIINEFIALIPNDDTVIVDGRTDVLPLTGEKIHKLKNKRAEFLELMDTETRELIETVCARRFRAQS